jgi:hypothetical protein
MEGLLLIAVIYAIYHLTLYPSTSGGDSGELLAEACVSYLGNSFW